MSIPRHDPTQSPYYKIVVGSIELATNPDRPTAAMLEEMQHVRTYVVQKIRTLRYLRAQEQGASPPGGAG